MSSRTRPSTSSSTSNSSPTKKSSSTISGIASSKSPLKIKKQQQQQQPLFDTSLNPNLPRLPSLPSLFNASSSSSSNSSSTVSSSIVGGGGNKNRSSSPIKKSSTITQLSSKTISNSNSNSKKELRKLKQVKKKNNSNNKRSSEDPETSFSLDESSSDEEEQEEGEERLIPTRKLGFSSLPSSSHNNNNNNKIKLVETETDDDEQEEEEGGFATARESSSNSIIDLSSTSTTTTTSSSRPKLVMKNSSSTRTISNNKDKDVEEVNGKRENVVVCLRVRPTKSTSTINNNIYKFNEEESRLSLQSHHPVFLKRGGGNITTATSFNSKSTTTTIRDEYEFKFDALHLSPLPTSDLYETKIRPVVRAAMEGFNGTVFAYGQTASGKTHTMIGNDNEPGIIPLAIGELFDYISEQDSTRTFTLRVSFLEIYNENFHDLLLLVPRPSSSKPLEVNGEDGQVKGLEERPVSGPLDVLGILEEGEMRRRTGETDWNERSSRSHCVFIVVIESIGKVGSGIGGAARTSRLNLIDLAGSESATGQDERRKEGAFINKSLLTLGTVIGKLTEAKGSGPQHIPYRDSKLTRLLQPALSGNSRVAIICTISPDIEQSTETLSTLKFAKRAKMVVTKAERGVLMTERMMLQVYATQVAALQAQIASKESGIEDATLKNERDSAIAKATELQSRNQKAEDELILKELELTRLKEQLAHTKSFILTGPVLEENARRISGSFPSMIMMSPSKGGKRVVSEMSGLGFGTPRGSSMRIASVGSKEKDSNLEIQLLQAEAKLARLQLKDSETTAALRSELETVKETSTSVRAEHDSTITDLNHQITELQAQIDNLNSELILATSRAEGINRTKLAELADLLAQIEVLRIESKSAAEKEEELKRLRSELLAAKERFDQHQKDAIVLAGSNTKAEEVKLSDLQVKLASAIEDSARKEKALLDMEAKLRSSEKRAVKGEGKTKVIEARDASIASLERELAFVKKELASVTVTKGFAIQSAQDLATSAGVERDIALRSVEEAKARVVQVEELASVESGRHEESEKMLIREHKAEVDHLKAEVRRLELEVAEWKSKANRLQRAADAREELEQQQAAYTQNAKAGTDSLKSKLAELQLRSSTTSSTGTSTRSSSRASNQISPRTDQMEKVVDLEIKNAELQVKLSEMERLAYNSLPKSHSSTFGPSGLGRTESSDELAKITAATAAAELKERERLHSIVESQNALLKESQAAADSWREKYLASQKVIDQLSDNTSSLPLPPPSTRSYLREMSNNDASLPRLSKGSLGSTTSTLKHHSAGPSSSYTSSPQSHSYTGFVPPPLPYSPRNTEKERKLRRETINKDLARLAESRGVEKTIEALGSPTTSPRKGSTLPVPSNNSSPSVKDRENFLHRRSKSSTDTSRYWT